ncbi:DUF2642 domain-containing protein [Aneurinibacillus danicus]|uniref:DUF2642 domain-containing protein n=1 Tax=Aneurinibacillus danicus TaxID=267746 RepID=A0A511V196_9BACL|nr:DUF2642 domain-containing protein [Aneurinibacillus danicus]GEN32660.1 hypothetical protein ADA01nite_01200 [Aneurinibacillus danicus]
MGFLHQYIGQFVCVELSGEKKHEGKLLDVGNDILVLNTMTQFIYLPLTHIQYVNLLMPQTEESMQSPNVGLINHENEISFRKILNNAKGLFIEIYVTGNQSLHGYVTGVLSDYFVFYSPVYKTMFIPFFHLKWLIPYSDNKTPYSLDSHLFPLHPSNVTPARSFDLQLKKLEGSLVVFDIGQHPNKVGVLKRVDGGMIELTTVNGTVCCGMQHIKTAHFPDL